MKGNSQAEIQVEAIRALTSEIPLNDFGMATGIYRTDLLPYHDYKPRHSAHATNDDDATVPVVELLPPAELEENTESEVGLTKDLHEIAPRPEHRIAGFPASALQGAFMPLQFDEGYPAFDNGLPFWGRLDFEPADAYEAFQKYLQMSRGRASTLEGEGEDESYDGGEAAGTRSISLLAGDIYKANGNMLDMIEIFQSYYHMYYWGMRAHAYDLFRIAQYRTQQEIRGVETQDEHYVQSRRLRHRLQQYMNETEDFWDMMTPKIGIDMFKTLTQLERISAGLPAAGPLNEQQDQGKGKPFEVTLQTVANTNRRGGAKLVTEDGDILTKALEDPESTEILQKLIIKAGV